MIFLVVCLAVWRIAHFIAKDDGPFHFMWDIRCYYTGSSFGDLLSCVDCNSAWVAAPFAYYCFDENRMLYWLAISAVATIIEGIWRRL